MDDERMFLTGGTPAILIRKAKNKFLMLRVLKELTGHGATIQSFREDADNALALRQRRSTQVSEDSQGREPVDTEQDNLLAAGDSGSKAIRTSLMQFIIPHYSPLKALWDWITLLLVLYTAVCTPYMAAFLLSDKPSNGGSGGTKTEEDVNSTWWNSTSSPMNSTTSRGQTWDTSDVITLNRIDKFVDVMFIADILINFRTTYLHNGEVIDDPRKIAFNYVRGWFIIDAVAAIPFDLLLQHTGTSDTMTMTGVLKTARLLRLLRVARRIDQYSEYGAAVLILLMATFTLIAHWLACLFYLLTNYERSTLDVDISWLDKLAISEDEPYIMNVSDSGPSIRARYITSLYFCFTILTSVGFGNVAPNTNYEKVFTIFAMLLGSLMSAAIFGNVSSIMVRLYRGTEEYHEKLASIKEFIKFHYIPKPLANRLVESYQHSRSLTQGVDMNTVLKGFPDCLQADICLHLNRNLLSNCRAFKEASPGCLRALSTKFKSTHAPPGDTLIHPGDILDSIYFVARGTIEIIKDEDIFMAILGKDDVFGEDIKKWYWDQENIQGKSDYSVRAMSYCDLHMITISDLQDIMDSYPEFAGDFLQNFGVTFNLRQEERNVASKEDHKMAQFIRLRRRRSYFPDQSRSQTVSRAIPSSTASHIVKSLKTSARPTASRGSRRRVSSSFEGAVSGGDEDDRSSSIVELSPQLSGTNISDNYFSQSNAKKVLLSATSAHPSVEESTSDERRRSGERRSWQSYARLKKSNNYTRPRTLATKHSWQNADDNTASTSKASMSPPLGLIEVGTAGSSDAGDASIDLIMDSIVPPSGVQTGAILSPIASGSSSMTYAPKSSPSSSGEDKSPMESDMLLLRPGDTVEQNASYDAASSAAAINYLSVLDERLCAINQRMGNFEQDLCTTVDTILELLGYEPSMIRQSHGASGYQRGPGLGAAASPSLTSYASTSCSIDDDGGPVAMAV